MREVSADTLRLVLGALDVAADTDAAARDSLARLQDAGAASLAPMITGDVERGIAVPGVHGRWRVTLDSGQTIEGHTTGAEAALELPPIMTAGYHELEIGDARCTLAVAPSRCYGVADLRPGKMWGLAAQLYALRRSGDGGIGDFKALREFVTHAAQAGADAVAISPIHAQFSADLDRYSPYSPSSRVQLNVMHADADEVLPGDADAAGAPFEALALIDWPGAARNRLARFGRAFAAFREHPSHPLAAAFAEFRVAGGTALESHARFESLHAHFFGHDPHLWHWQTWPEPFRDPRSAAVAAYARDHAQEIDFHAFLQFVADRGLAAAQGAARAGGMRIGLISDLAVGTDGGGSHAWSRQGETLMGLSIGAPPDILSKAGQDWGLAAFSPTGLVRHGFSAYLEMLRGALKHAGGVRIDHVMGLARLWVLPAGASPSEGAYLNFPLHDLVRLIALESQRFKAVILGEDLGTVPDGFQQQLDDRRIMGLRVLWFETEGERFRPPARWTRSAAAMTSTHDLATVAGWWTGHDLELRGKLGMLGDDTGAWFAYENRARERARLWDAMRESGAAAGEAPSGDTQLPVVDAAIRHIAGAGCELALLPLEDAIGATEQPNLPGTTDQHPNWRRRLAFDAPALFADELVARRLRSFDEARKSSDA